MRRLLLLLSACLVSLVALAGTANAALLFNGASLSNFTVEGETGTITEVSDPLGSGQKVFKNIVTDSNLTPFGNPRAQQTSTALFTKGTELWLKTKILFPSTFPTSIPNGNTLLSIYGAPYAGSAPFALDTYGDTLEWQRNGTYGWDIPWEMPLERDKWISIVVHEKFDEAGKGFVEMWVNGEQVTFFKSGSSWNPNKVAATTKLTMATMDSSNDKAANNVRLQQNRVKGDVSTSTVYFGPLKIGNTRDDVSSASFIGRKISDFAANESASGAVTEVSDPLGSGETVLQMTVDDEDVYPVTPTENPRAQLLSPDTLAKGNEFWLSTKFLIPSAFPSVPEWLALVSVYGAPYDGPGPWVLEVADDELHWQRNGTYSWDIPWSVPLVKGSWTRVLLHMKLAESGAGFVEMWIDNKRISFFNAATNPYNPLKIKETNSLAMSTMDASNNGAANSARISQYRELGQFDEGTLYFGPLRIGPERADVDY